MPQAKITATALDTAVASTTETNNDGYYTLPALSPGRYSLLVEKSGFSPVHESGLALTVQQVARVDITLTVGQLAESVQVTAQTPLLESESATLGQVVNNRQVTELPLLGRNSYALAMLVPGVRPSTGVNNMVVDQISTVSYAINGQRPNSNEFLLDGAPNSAAAQNQPVVNANPDTVQEFKVETNNFSAEYGRASGGVFNVITKSGTNALHGSLFEFIRNDVLNANDWFANRSNTRRPPFKFNQFGGSLGGPVVIPKVYNGRNRTFFFVNTELVRFAQGVTFTGTLPDPQMLAGNFSNARLANGQLVTIYDPATTRLNPAGAGYIRDPFPGNIIPSDRIDPVARAYSKLIPAPNIPGKALGATNYARTDSNRIEKNSYSARVDHNFDANNRVFARFSYDDTPWNRALVYGSDFATSTPSAGPQTFRRWNGVVEGSRVFAPTLIGTVRYSATRLVNFRRPYSDNFNIESLGLPSYLRAGMVDPISLPALTITGNSVASSVSNVIVGGLIGATDYINFGNTSHALQGNVTKSLSSHTLKIGGEYRVIQFNNLQVADTATNFGFSPQWTQGPNPTASSTTAGLGLASFLLGIPSGGVAPVPALAQTTKYYALFLQDSWKLTPKITVNWGLRYDYEAPRTDRYNQLSNFDFQAASPLQVPGLALNGGLIFPGVNGLPRGQVNPDRNNFAPRLGIAWRVTPKTVIRTGGGIFYAGTTGLGAGPGAFGVSGYQATTSLVTSQDGVTPTVRWSNPYPTGFNRPTGSSAGLSTLLGQSIQFADRGNVTPVSYQWNFNIQQELPGRVLFEIGYAGSRGLHLFENRQWNQLDPQYLAQGDRLRQTVSNPFAGKIAVGTFASPTITRAQLLRPYPQFDSVASQASSWASSTYHALEMRAEKRYSNGFNVLASYTYSKILDYGTGPFGGETLGSSSIQNWSNLQAEWGVSTLDQTHRFIFNTVYELPFFKDGHGLLGKTLGGWQTGAIWSAYSGGPLGVTSAVNNTFSQGGGQRPNWNGQNPCVADPTPDRWLDASVFSAPPAYMFGNAPRTFGGCRSAGANQVDATLTKNTRITERWNIQLRTEIFNVANSVRFNPPNQTSGNAQFGVVNSQANLPRIIQFGLKVLW